MAGRSILARVFALPLGIRFGAVIAAVVLVGSLTLVGTGIIPLGSTPVRLAVSPDAALLTSVGATRALTAATVDANGKAAPVSATWTSSRPDVVAVDAAGLLTAEGIGSAQVTATAASLTSPPVLVVVATPATGVVLIDDAQVVGEPTAALPGGTPPDGGTYLVTVKGLSPAVGAHVLGTGSKAILGEVLSTTPASDGAVALTVGIVPVDEVLPDLAIDETIDLTNAPVEIDPAVAAAFDVVRSGTHFTFTIKPGLAGAGQWPLGLIRPATIPRGVLEGIDIPVPKSLFNNCERDGTIQSGEEDIPFQPLSIADGPTLDVDINPTLEYAWSSHEKRLIVRTAPTAKVSLGLKVEAKFEVTWECQQTLLAFPVAVPPPLALIAAPLVAVGVGFKIGGEVNIASAELGLKTTVSGSMAMGFACPAGAQCGLVHDFTGDIQKPTYTVKLLPEGIKEIRFKPAFEAFLTAGLQFGSPFLKSLRLEGIEAQIGPKAELDWAPRIVQITDASYASNLKVSLAIEIKPASDLAKVIKKFHLEGVIPTKFEKSIDIGASPGGTLDVSKTSTTPGERTSASVHIGENLELFGLYDIDRVVLVRSSGGTLTELATATATAGQADFELSFTTPQLFKPGELHAFIVPKIPPGGVVDFEVASPKPAARILFFRRDQTTFRLFAVDTDGANEREIPLALSDATLNAGPLSWTADGTRIGFQTSRGPAIANADGSNVAILGGVASGPAWAPDASGLLVVRRQADSKDSPLTIAEVRPDGTLIRNVIQGGGYVLDPSWSPDGRTILYQRARNHGAPGISSWADYGWEIWAANADGSDAHVLSPTVGTAESHVAARWSPDGTRILYVGFLVSGDTIAWQLWVMGADGSNPRRLVTGPDVVAAGWSPDGSKVVFAQGDLLSGQLWVMNADGTGQTKLALAPGTVDPSWLP